MPARRAASGLAPTARKVVPTQHGLVLDVETRWGEARLESPLFGRFNAYNILAVLATLLLLEVPLAEAVKRLRDVRPVPGRTERFGGRNGRPLVIVDYAHTPDALEKVLASLREHTRGKLITSFVPKRSFNAPASAAQVAPAAAAVSIGTMNASGPGR